MFSVLYFFTNFKLINNSYSFDEQSYLTASFNSNKRSAAKRARRSSASFVAIFIDHFGWTKTQWHLCPKGGDFEAVSGYLHEAAT